MPSAGAAPPASPAPPELRPAGVPAEHAEPLPDAVHDRRCFLAGELVSAWNPEVFDGDGEAFAMRVRERLLPPDRAAAIAGPLAWQVVDALLERRFDRIASFLGKEGLCLRASKGAGCVQLSKDEVAACERDKKKRDWPVDSGDDAPFLRTCSQAMRDIFLKPELRRPSRISHNCFPEAGRGNNVNPVVLRPASAFVEFHVSEEPWLSLWLVFDESPGTPGSSECNAANACDDRGQRLYLVELMAEYWGI